ncbi:hypothetical protein GCM10027098_39700 [Bowmanella dokdonensis]
MLELMVVLLITSALLGLVAPVSIRQVEKSREHVELLEFQRDLKRLEQQAFLLGQDIEVNLEGKKSTIVQGMHVREHVFTGLFFEPQRIKINANGEFLQPRVEVFYRGEKRTIRTEEQID